MLWTSALHLKLIWLMWIALDIINPLACGFVWIIIFYNYESTKVEIFFLFFIFQFEWNLIFCFIFQPSTLVMIDEVANINKQNGLINGLLLGRCSFMAFRKIRIQLISKLFSKTQKQKITHGKDWLGSPTT